LGTKIPPFLLGVKDIKDTGDFSKVVPKLRNILKAVNGNTKVSGKKT
jgi:hypothetical protein